MQKIITRENLPNLGTYLYDTNIKEIIVKPLQEGAQKFYEINDLINEWNRLGIGGRTDGKILIVKDKVEFCSNFFSGQAGEINSNFKNIIFEDNFWSNLGRPQFDDCYFKKDIVLEISRGKINFINCNLDNGIDFQEGNYDSVKINGGFFKKVNFISKKENPTPINLENLTIKDSIIGELNLEGVGYQVRENFLFKTNIDITLGKGKINNILLKNIRKLNRIKISINKGKRTIDTIKLSNLYLTNEDTAFFINLNINNLIIQYCTFESTRLKFNRLKIIKYLVMNDTTFNKTIFSGINFKDECDIFIKLPVFTETIFNDINWGKITFLEKEKNKEIQNTTYEQKDIYRQLKHVMERNGNHTEANKFYTKEMQYHGKTLKNIFDKILFFISRISSEYGTNWKLALYWIFLFGILISYIISIYYNPEQNKFWNIFACTINPFSGLGENTDLSHLLNKVLFSYLIYQFIISVRRQTKR